MEKKEEKIELIDVYAEHVYANLVSFNVNPRKFAWVWASVTSRT
jgi:hypothetical protein